MHVDYIALGQRIRFYRRQRGLTQEQLAELTDMSASFIGHIERGSRIASLETFMSLCRALEVTPDMLLLGAERAGEDALPAECRNALEKIISGAYELAQIAKSACQ